MEYRFLWFVSTCNNDFEANSTSLMSLWANIKFFPEPTGELYGWLLATLVFVLLGGFSRCTVFDWMKTVDLPWFIVVVKKTLSLFHAQQEHLARQLITPHITQIPRLKSQYGDSDHLQNLINCSLYHCKAILNISSKSALSLLSNGPISSWTVSMVIWVSTKV